MCDFVKSVFLILVTMISVLYFGFALKTLWDWFVVTSFNLPPLSLATAMGLVVMSSLFKSSSPVDKNESDADYLAKGLVEVMVRPTMVLLCGWIVSWFV